MRVECTQCGGVLDIRGPGSLARCSWCGALSRYSWEGGVFFHEPALDQEQAARLFPPGEILPPSLMWFPYMLHGSQLGKAFSQPYPVLDDYVPPSGELRPWPEGGDPRGETVPSECLEGRLVYHPFYSVTITSTGEGMLLDGGLGRSTRPWRTGRAGNFETRRAIHPFASCRASALGNRLPLAAFCLTRPCGAPFRACRVLGGNPC